MEGTSEMESLSGMRSEVAEFQERDTEMSQETETENSPTQLGSLHPGNVTTHQVNNMDADSQCKFSDKNMTEIIETIAATGKYWHEWDTLKSLLSCRMKQILAEYPESQMFVGPEPPQSSLSGKTYLQLVERLNEELQSFVEGPPFTLQRLCEILLTAKQIYPMFSKLVLALEKNLLVTSTLSRSMDPYPSPRAAAENQPHDSHQIVPGYGEESDKHIEDQTDSIKNGISPSEGITDQEMSEVEAHDDSQIQENKIIATSESCSELTAVSKCSPDPSAEI